LQRVIAGVVLPLVLLAGSSCRAQPAPKAPAAQKQMVAMYEKTGQK
jgi:hypothetical protein